MLKIAKNFSEKILATFVIFKMIRFIFILYYKEVIFND